MVCTPEEKQGNLLLSKLTNDTNVKANQAGTWDSQNNNAFSDIASSLDYSAPGQTKSVSSVPTMWARPLTMKMALYRPDHPIHQQMVEQWQGMLAAIALAEVRGFNLKAEIVELNKQLIDDFGRSLYQLLPNPIDLLYRREGKNPWEEIYVFIWNDRPVGMTTPNTLVCPSEEATWQGLPWWDAQNSLLKSPKHFLNDSEKQLLWAWLENLQQQLADTAKYQGDRKAINTIVNLLGEFRASLLTNPNPRPTLTLSDNHTFFGQPINRGALELLNYPVQAPPRPSNVRVVSSPNKSQTTPLLIIDPMIASHWGANPQDIWVHSNKTLASLDRQDLEEGKIVWPDVRWLKSQDLFLPELHFIDVDNALPGGILPKSKAPLTFKGQSITILLPLNSILTDYFTSEDLINKLELTPFNDHQGQGVRIYLNLPLSGIKPGTPSQNYRIAKEYILKEENAIKYLPVLTIWPYFNATKWQEYYTFYYDGEFGQDTFLTHFPGEQAKTFKSANGSGQYQISTLKQLPSCVICQNSTRQPIGLILLATLPQLQSRETWAVGVDFGTSFTNIYFKTGNAEPLPLKFENLQWNITTSPITTRFVSLLENFIPESFLPEQEPLPLCSVLTTKDGDETTLAPILDGRIYVPDVSSFEPSSRHIKLNLKWAKENRSFSKTFIQHLVIHISALAAKVGVNTIEWSISYPSAFSSTDVKTYHATWETILHDLAPKTGITHSCPDFRDPMRFGTESVALAQYFNDQERHSLIRTTCIDMGGGTSDISIWQERKIVYQCSILFAGREIFSQFLVMNPKFAKKLLQENLGRFNELSLMTKVDVWLRHYAEEWLRKERIEKQDDPYFLELITLIALGTAGLYYYVGMILQVLHQEEVYTKNDITSVYIGGNASRFLHWVSPTGKHDSRSDFNVLLSRMLSRGSGFPDSEEITRLSTRPKHEVACGLVLKETQLTGITKNTDKRPIAGEEYQVKFNEDGEQFNEAKNWQDRLELQGTIERITIPELTNLERFLDEFHLALIDLQIEDIKPLPKAIFKPERPRSKIQDSSSTTSSNRNEQLWKLIHKDLEDTLLDIKGDAKNIRPEPPFILGLKSLLKVLGKKWSESYRE